MILTSPLTSSLAALAAAVLLRGLLDPVMGDALPLVTLFGAVGAGGVGGRLASGRAGRRPRLPRLRLSVHRSARQLGLDRSANLVGLVAYLFTCALIIGIGEAMRRAQCAGARRGELLRVTLGSIGDAVITTDNEGRVTYLNAVAESLTGWSQADAAGQPLDEVFRDRQRATRAAGREPGDPGAAGGHGGRAWRTTRCSIREGRRRAADRRQRRPHPGRARPRCPAAS